MLWTKREATLIGGLKRLQERMRRVVGMYDSDIDLITEAIREIEKLKRELGNAAAAGD